MSEPSTISEPRFHHVGVAARDPERTIAFYAHLLGARTVAMHGHVVVVAGSVRIAVVADEPIALPRAHHLALAFPADAKDVLVARLDELDAEHEDVRGRIYVRDPDGLVVELIFEPSS